MVFMRVAILFNAVAPDAAAFERDVLVQVAAVERVLRSQGHDVSQKACTLNLDALRHDLSNDRPDLVFNLVESLGGSDRLITLVPALLETLGIPFTGTGSFGLTISTHKTFAKERLRQAGCPTPDWLVASPGTAPPGSGEVDASGGGEGAASAIPVPPVLIKAVFEHGSFGLDDEAVVLNPAADVAGLLKSRAERLGCECFAERYIAGREFNLSLLANDDGSLRVLPPAEIQFVGFAPDKPHIVGAAAKWEEASTEFVGTPRTFEFPASDAPLLARLSALALQCWQLFELRGYARVDFRVDEQGEPWILEVNANPCLSPAAGFAAAVEQAGLSFDEAVRRIVAHAAVGRRAGAAPKQNAAEKAPLSPHSTDKINEANETNPPRPADTIRSLFEPSELTIRHEVRPEDSEAVRRIVASTGFFYPAEIDVAVELIDDRIAKGERSDYRFLFAERDGETIGYSCYGLIACTLCSHDLYWIAVDANTQRGGVGRRLLKATEQQIAALGPGQQVYIETSNRPQYQPTRTFYERCGYTVAGVFPDFYGPGDDKVVYVRRL